jgi:arginase
MSSITILEFPSNLGLIEPSPGAEPGVKKLPHWLRKHHFHQRINPAHTSSLEPPPYTMNIDKPSGVRNADAIVLYAQEQVPVLLEQLEKNNFVLVLGGDCSILIGTMLALKYKGRYGLFYLDGHHDFMWPELSHTGGAAGMDLAIITGYGHEKLTNIAGMKPYVQEKHIWCVGNREYDDWYAQPIKDSNIHYVDLPSLREQKIARCVKDFLEMVEKENLDGFWIHLDVDVLNDDVMPAVDSRTADGLTYEELNELLQPLLAHPKVAGIEITILDPELDPTGEYTEMFVENFCTAFEEARKE